MRRKGRGAPRHVLVGTHEQCTVGADLADPGPMAVGVRDPVADDDAADRSRQRLGGIDPGSAFGIGEEREGIRRHQVEAGEALAVAGQPGVGQA